jgi:hypothetical protein
MKLALALIDYNALALTSRTSIVYPYRALIAAIWSVTKQVQSLVLK